MSPAPGSITASTTSARDQFKDRAFRFLMFFSLAVGIVTLAALLIQVTVKGWPRLNLELVTSFPSPTPENAGMQSALFGTIWLMFLTALISIPVGVGAAIYLEEYANEERWYNRMIEVNIQNLAAVPSIVYGILGLAFIVRGIGLGRVVLAGSLILSLLVLPTVIIAAREAIRAVPSSIRQGSMALGATQWQTIRRQVLPAAIPGIATGSILALSRAIGETAPLLLVGALTFISFNPSGLDTAFTAMPVQIFNWTARPQEEFKIVAAAGIVLLLVMLLAMNAFAIYIRNKYQRRW